MWPGNVCLEVEAVMNNVKFTSINFLAMNTIQFDCLVAKMCAKSHGASTSFQFVPHTLNTKYTCRKLMYSYVFSR